MSRSIERFALGAVLSTLLLGRPATARAQYDHWELGVHAGVLWVDLFEQNTKMPAVGARVTRHFDNGWGLGPFFDYAWENDALVYHSMPLTDVQIYMYGGEVDYTFPSSGPFYFFVKSGVGAATVQLDTIGIREDERIFLEESQTRFMLSPGFGFKILNNATNPFLAFRVDFEDRIIFNFPKRFRAHETEEPGFNDKVNRDEFTNNLVLTGGVSFLFGGAPRPAAIAVVPACPPVPVCPVPVQAPVQPEPICVEELWWYRTDSTITVLGRNWVKFGTATVMDRDQLVQVSDIDGVPIFVEITDDFPYDRLWVPLCLPPNNFQQYVPEQEIRGTTG
jgi:hypothetical protein